jgi:transcriptional regulator with XRE-family HTH domain
VPALRKLGFALRVLRCRRNLTQVEAAARSGVRQSEISRIETAESVNIETDTLEKLLDAYGADLFDLAVEVRAAQFVPNEVPLTEAEAKTGADSVLKATAGLASGPKRDVAPAKKTNGGRG